MKAKRINSFAAIENDKLCYWKAIQYGKEVWFLYHPDCGLGGLDDHEVTEHKDGTISVSPSIKVTTQNKGKTVTIHGYLEKGIWRDC